MRQPSQRYRRTQSGLLGAADSRRRTAAAKAGLLSKTLEAEKLKIQIARLKRMSFGASSERMRRELEQLELKLEELETAEAEAEAAAETAPAMAEQPAQEEAPAKKQRRKLPEALPRRDIVHEPACACTVCGGALRKVGEDVTEILGLHPRPLRGDPPCAARLFLPQMRGHGAKADAIACPSRAAQAGPGLLAHVLIAKFCDHLPLYRQAEIYARDGVDLDRATLATGLARRPGWLSRWPTGSAATSWQAASSMPMTRPCRCLPPATARPRPAGSGSIFATSGPMPAPRRPPCSTAIPRTAKASIAATILLPLQGICMPMAIAALASFTERKTAGPPPSTEVACWAHVRRKFFDVH